MPIMEVHEEAVAERSAPAQVQPSAPDFTEYKPLFADALLETQWRGTQRRRGWSTAISFLVQAILLSVVVIVPLMYTDMLPRQQLMTYLVAPPPPPPPSPAATEQIARTVRSVETEIINGQLRTPAKIPERVKMIKEEEAPPPVGNGGVVGGVPGGIPGGQVGGVIGGIISDTAKVPILPKLPKAMPQRVRVSQGVSAGMLVHQIKPEYPPLARAARIQGQVVLSAVIGKDGAIQNLQVISGHPMLVPAAVQAVQKWLYRPYLLNGEPVEVVTQVLVTFTLSAD